MPRGRPKAVVAPCQYCNKQFKRQEHLLRHERTHTHEKPFTCDCGQGFSRQDLLTRHARLSHPSCPDISPPSVEAVQAPTTICDANVVGIDDLDLFWDPNFMTQDLLPTTLFDTNFSSVGTPQNIQPPQISSFSRFSSRLPSFSDTNDDLEDGDQAEDIAEDITGANAVPPWVISESGYETFCLGAQSYSDVLPPRCLLPSRNSLIRYLEKYLRCVQEFLPIFHHATFSVEHKDVELLLAIAALGAAYTYEHPKAYEMYFLAKAILAEKTRREDLQLTSDLLYGQSHSTHYRETDLGRMQVFILLISFASWADKNFLPDALSMGSKLALLVRKNGISDSDEIPRNIDWLSWVAVEERRRTLFAAYVLLNMHSIAFGIPPLILNHEIGIFLPSYAETWKSIDATQWRQTTLQVELQFQEGLRCFFDGSGIPKDASVSSFSNYLLIHGILQQIYIDRHSSRGLLELDVVMSFETALCNWQRSWEQTYESTLDPLSPKGPFGLTATALLRLAYIRLNSELSPCRGLLSGDLRCITNRRSSLKRSPHIDKAVLHAAHALSVPVRLGVTHMASTKTSIWTIEHSLCSLECALLLKDWLEMISTTVRTCGTEELRKAERKLLGIITGIIKETSFAETLNILEDEASRFQRMAITVVKLWAQIFQGIHVLEIDNVIGAGLQLLADSNSNSSPN